MPHHTQQRHDDDDAFPAQTVAESHHRHRDVIVEDVTSPVNGIEHPVSSGAGG